ncbi:stage II sporulation protein M [Clostridium omnivorum]|uniref:Stage II sporulation protein M n=1 Tax=Clostridium omnivorum TaxID=1604902 RepID=A0ABQ5NB04_9CLOT|nr:stage II sporulation protein M [Clostridium sp. E14]GLC32445.1 stage II sporulation protein M [Clostridium sp. E14]
MKNDKLASNFNKHLQENFWLYIISLLCVFTGVVLGIYAVKYMGDFEKSDLVSYIQNFTTNIKSQSINNKNVFLGTLKNNFIMTCAIWFLGLTMIGIPIILVVDVIKGFTLGFSISFFLNGIGSKGIGVVLLGIMPQNIIYIPCIIFCSVIAMEFSLNFLKEKINNKWTKSIWVKIVSYSFAFLIVFLVMCFGFIIEAYISPLLIKLIL